MATNAISDTLRQTEKPNEKSKKGGAKGSVARLKESIQFGCISRFLSDKIYSTWAWNVGIETRSQILQGYLAPK